MVVDANAPLLECLAAEPHWLVMGRPGHLSVQESGTASQETQTLRQCLGVWDSLGLSGTRVEGHKRKDNGFSSPYLKLSLIGKDANTHQIRGSLNEAVNEYYGKQLWFWL